MATKKRPSRPKAARGASPPPRHGAGRPADAAGERGESPAAVPQGVDRRETSLARHDPLAAYLADVARHPVLPPEEQIALARRYRETGDLEAAYKLVTANLRLVVKIAHEYRRSAFSLLDLIQEGNVGLMRAVKKFDPYRGIRLSSYAAWWIRAYILRYLMENWRQVKIGTTRAQRRLFFNLRRETEKLLAQGLDPEPKLLAERLQVSEADVIDMDRRLGHEEVSLDAPVGGDTKQTHLDHLAMRAAPTDERLAQDQLKALVREKLSAFGATLKDREKLIFDRRLVAEDRLTLQDIGDRFGITRERARQIEADLIRRLRAYLERELPDFKDLRLGSEAD